MHKPDTIVLIHGLFMTALSWEKWVERYTSKGFRVIAKSWPGMDRDIAALRLMGISRWSVVQSIIIEAALVAVLGSRVMEDWTI